MGNFFSSSCSPLQINLNEATSSTASSLHTHTLQHIHCWLKLPPNTKCLPNKAEQEHNPTATPSEVTQSARNLPKSGEDSHKTQPWSGQNHKSSLVRNPFLFAHRSLVQEKILAPPPIYFQRLNFHLANYLLCLLSAGICYPQ